MGLEQEYAVMVDDPEAARSRECATLVLTLAGRPSRARQDQFLGNGGRLYIDAGDHPEYATPECVSLSELIAADLAGVRILGEIALTAEARLQELRGGPVRVSVVRNNLGLNGTTWGTHENYLVSSKLRWLTIADRLSAFLVSRQCFAGAGTLIPRPGAPGGRFRLSQRAPFVDRVIAASAIAGNNQKPMMLARDEPLGPPSIRRVQITVGDASVLQATTALKIGTTCAALRLAEIDRAPLVRFEQPVQALQAYSDDPSLRALAWTNRGWLRALDVQAIWLEDARRHLERAGLSHEESTVLDRWERTLTDLESDPERLIGRLDWVTKRSVLDRLAAREGLRSSHPRLVQADLAFHDVHPVRGTMWRLPQFDRLVSDHDIDAAVSSPPASTRAAARGALVSLVRATGVNYEVDWHWLRVKGRSVERWVSLLDPTCAWPKGSREMAEILRDLARTTP